MFKPWRCGYPLIYARVRRRPPHRFSSGSRTTDDNTRDFLRGGHKTIYVNLFLPESREQWRSDVVLVCDGGIGFWGVEFDTTSGTFVHIAYNGVA